MVSMRSCSDIVLFTLWTFSCISSALPVPTSDRIPECSHLHIEDNQKFNSYIGTHGGRCCMCPKGTYLAGECNINDPNSTICKQCQYDEEIKSYIDFEPHQQEECTIDESTCMNPKVYIPGSPSSPHQCKCPDGTVEVDLGFRCESYVTPTASSEKQLTTRKNFTPTSTHVAPEITAKKPSTSSKEGLPDIDKLHSTEGVKETVLSILSPTTTVYQREVYSTVFSTDVTHTEVGGFLIIRIIVAVALICIAICCIVIFASWKYDKRVIRIWRKTNKNSHLAENSGPSVLFVRQKRNDDGQLDSKEPKHSEQTAPLVSGRNEAGVNKSTDVVKSQTKEDFNESTPLVEGPPETITDVPTLLNSSQPVNEKGVPESYRQCTLSKKDEPDSRYKASEDMAKVITKSDLCNVGRQLLPKNGRHFDDINDKQIGREEKAMQMFIRAAELNPKLNLQEILEATNGLGYLQDIIKKYIE